MTDHKALTLLQEANPIQDSDGSAPAPNGVLESILAETRSRRPAGSSRILVVTVAASAAAIAAAAIGIFVVAPTGSHRAATDGAKSAIASARPGFGVVGTVPSNPIALSDASAALGAPVVLPNSSLVTASDAGTATEDCARSGPSNTSSCNITVSFPSQGLTVRYTRATYSDPLAVYQGDVTSSTDGAKVAYISGVPALVIPENPGNTTDTASYVEFVVGGTSIGIVGHYDAATLESVAKSIIDQANASGS